jgi:hypothetical protein
VVPAFDVVVPLPKDMATLIEAGDGHASEPEAAELD